MGTGSATDRIFERLEHLRKSWPKSGWSWDYRFSCVASSFHVDLTAAAQTALGGVLPDRYDHMTIGRAPQNVRELADQVGGVREDQVIYSCPSEGRLVPYALWWPWGDEITISLRLGLVGYVGESDFERLKVQFNAID